MSDKAATIAMRNAVFEAGDGMSLESFMLGSIMAQTRIAVEMADTPEQAAKILSYYFEIAIEAVPAYWAGRSGKAAQ